MATNCGFTPNASGANGIINARIDDVVSKGNEAFEVALDLVNDLTDYSFGGPASVGIWRPAPGTDDPNLNPPSSQSFYYSKPAFPGEFDQLRTFAGWGIGDVPTLDGLREVNDLQIGVVPRFTATPPTLRDHTPPAPLTDEAPNDPPSIPERAEPTFTQSPLPTVPTLVELNIPPIPDLNFNLLTVDRPSFNLPNVFSNDYRRNVG